MFVVVSIPDCEIKGVQFAGQILILPVAGVRYTKGDRYFHPVPSTGLISNDQIADINVTLIAQYATGGTHLLTEGQDENGFEFIGVIPIESPIQIVNTLTEALALLPS